MKAADGPAVVQELLSVPLERTDGRRWEGQCPWHEDEHPSFAVYLSRAGYWRVGCWTCGVDLSLAELVAQEKDLSPAEAVRYLLTGPELAEDMSPLPRGELAGFWTTRAKAAGLRPSYEVIARCFTARRYTVPVSWVARAWGVGTERDAVVVPHRDATGELVGVKLRRAPEWTPKSVPGSRLDPLYGVWRDEQHDRVIVCEGEGDAWHASYWLRRCPVDVLALPSGASQRVLDEWLDTLADRLVLLLPDHDSAGQAWSERLSVLLPGSGNITPPKSGDDVTSAGNQWVEDTYDRWVAATS